MNRKYIFIAMFRALDCLYDEKPSKELGEFLSEANPYLFKDRHSADPAVIEEFNQYVDAHIEEMGDTVKDAYQMVAVYLKDKGFSNIFSDISFGSEEKKSKKLELMPNSSFADFS